MNLPSTISRQALAKLSFPEETHAVRVILKKVANNAPYLVRGKTRRYLFERNPEAKAHCLDIPVSIWMQDVDKFNGYRPGTSIPEDLKPTISLPFMMHVVPWKSVASESSANDTDLNRLVDLLETVILRFAGSFDEEKCRSLLTDELRAAYVRPAQEVAEALLRKYGKNAVADFQKAMWDGKSTRDVTNILETVKKTLPPDPVESPAAARMRKMREAKAAKKQLETA
jgi:hypothetical protein